MAKSRTCKKCGKPFKVPPNREGNARKYCNQCQITVYTEHRRKARLKYNKLHPHTNGRTRICNWCANIFHSTNGQRYCSERCRKYARMEQNNIHQKKYRARHGKSEKQDYFDNLGNSNLHEHPHNSAKKELIAIKKEKKRLGV